MTVSNYKDLQEWFYGNTRKGNPAPYWTLFGAAWGGKETIVARNDHKENPDESYRWLEDTIRRVNNPEGQRFRILQVDVPAGNNPVGQVYAQIHSSGVVPAQVAGIGAIPGQIGKEEVASMIAQEREKWELQARVKELEAQVNSPNEDMIERTVSSLERISQTPFGAAIIAKLSGIPIGQVMAASVAAVGKTDDEPTADDEQFYSDIESSAEALGISQHQLARKLKNLISQNPDLARNLITSV